MARPVEQQPRQITQSLNLRTLASALSTETFSRRQHIDHRSRTMTEPAIVGYKVTFMETRHILKKAVFWDLTRHIFLVLVTVSLNFLLQRADMTQEKSEQVSARTVSYQFRLAHKRSKINLRDSKRCNIHSDSWQFTDEKGQNFSPHVKLIFRELKSKSSQTLNSDRLIFLKRECFGKCARKAMEKLKNASSNKDAKKWGNNDMFIKRYTIFKIKTWRRMGEIFKLQKVTTCRLFSTRKQGKNMRLTRSRVLVPVFKLRP
jgi:hypothetical protein